MESPCDDPKCQTCYPNETERQELQTEVERLRSDLAAIRTLIDSDMSDAGVRTCIRHALAARHDQGEVSE